MKTTRLKTLLTALVLGSLMQSAPIWAQQPQADAKMADPSVIAAIKTAYPNTAFDQINATPIEGIYEVVMGKNIAYTDRTGQYFLFGNLFDMRTQTDLTQPKRLSLNKIDVKKLPLADAIKSVKGKGERKLVVFADPNCGYCKRFERDLQKVDSKRSTTSRFIRTSCRSSRRIRSPKPRQSGAQRTDRMHGKA